MKVLQNIQGTRRMVLITLAVMTVGLTAFSISYGICGNAEKSAAIAFAFAAAVAAAFASAFASASAFAFVAFAFVAFAAVAVAFVAFVAVAFAAVAVAVAVVAAAVAVVEGNELEFRKILLILLCEVLVFILAMTVWTPYLASITLAASGVGIIFLLGESKFRLWLADNPPPPVLYREILEMRGIKPFREAKVVVSRKPIPDPLRVRLHRRLRDIYA